MSRISCFITLCILGLALCSTATAASSAPKTGMPDRYQAGSQYLAYPRPAYGLPKLTEAPAGHVPFHIEHYGRHGSRWLLKDADYDRPVEALRKAQTYGKLTPRGQQLLGQLSKIADDSKGRVGELTPLGHRQHRDIARRMTENFPEIFVPGTHVDAKSTVIIRCILSMANEIAELQRICPELIVTCDASRTTQKILAYNSTDSVAKKLGRDAEKRYGEEFEKRHSDHSAFIGKIFNDPQFVADSLDEKQVFGDVFDIVVNTQSHDDQPDLYDVFTDDELTNEWLNHNASWYLTAGNTSLTNNRVPYNQRVLLRNIIESTDTAMVSPRLSANLRFGHESIVLPLTILMELDGNDLDTTDLDGLAANWRNYEIFPMGSNIQIVFYRPEGKQPNPDEVLVKVLLNEKEVTLPLDPVSGPYYKWSDLRDLYMTKLDNFPEMFSE